MHIKRAPIADINYLISDRELFDESRFDGCPESVLMPDSSEFEYYGLYENQIIGMAMLHTRADGKELHLAFRKGHRHKARAFTASIILNAGTIYACVPGWKKSVINMLLKIGFSSLGKHGTLSKNNVIYDMELLVCRGYYQPQ